MAYGIWTTVANGVTGSRSTWLKDAGQPLTFETMEAAEAEAERRTAATSLQGDYQYFRAATMP